MTLCNDRGARQTERSFWAQSFWQWKCWWLCNVLAGDGEEQGPPVCLSADPPFQPSSRPRHTPLCSGQWPYLASLSHACFQSSGWEARSYLLLPSCSSPPQGIICHRWMCGSPKKTKKDFPIKYLNILKTRYIYFFSIQILEFVNYNNFYYNNRIILISM